MKTSIATLVFAMLVCVAAGCASREGANTERQDKKPMSQAQERATRHGDPHSDGAPPQGYRFGR